jgi:site-specific DNA-methyltransferase (adenine-specific)
MSAIDWRVGDLPEALADFDDNTFHACLCDPPYGLSDPPPPDLLLKWLAGEDVEHGAGFLSRKWDSLPPPPSFWSELYRVLRPGAIVMAFSHSRTSDMQTMAMRMAGFEILPAFAWLHAEAQALGADVGKLIDKAAGAQREVVGTKAGQPGYSLSDDSGSGLTIGQGRSGTGSGDPVAECSITAPATPLAQLFHGHHSRLRTNYEPICVGMKPLDGTLAENAARWGCAVFDAEAGRIPTVSAEDDAMLHSKHLEASVNALGKSWLQSGSRGGERANGYSPAGRFPSSVLIEHHFDCQDGACVRGCPAAVLADQGGELRSGWTNGGKAGALCYGGRTEYLPYLRLDQGGTADRFFFQSRPVRKERSAGCERMPWERAPDHPDGWRIVDRERFDDLQERDRFEGNPHPALKSLELTRYLSKLLRQPGEARIVVPFSGSGSEGIGSMLAGWEEIVAFELSEQMVEVSRRREAFWRGIMDSGTEGSVKELGQHHPEQMGLW